MSKEEKAALIGGICLIIAAVITGLFASRAQENMPVRSLLTATTTSPSPMTRRPLPECQYRNLLYCSKHVPVFVPNESQAEVTSISDDLVVDFSNIKNGSGVGFNQFDPVPVLNLQGFNSLELVGTSTRRFTFVVEYKVLVGGVLRTCSTPTYSFPETTQIFTVTTALLECKTANEIVVNFPTVGQNSRLIIKSLLFR